MANLRELSIWEAGIYQLETSDPVMGGENGIDNRAPRQLANRTLWLKNELARQIELVNNAKLGKTDNAVSASKLATVRTISMTGDGAWNVNFDGTQNASATMTLANTGVTAGSYNSVTVDAKGRVTAGLTQTHGLVTATTTTGIANTVTTNNNTYLNIVASGVGRASSVGSSTQITGVNGVSVSSDTAGALTLSGTRATDTAVGVTMLSHNTNGTDKTKAASEFALGEVRRMANQAQVTADGIALTWNNVQNKPTTFTPSEHRHSWGEIDQKPSTYPPSQHTHDWNSITGKPAVFPASDHRHSWGEIDGKPSVFAPSSHTHAWSQITGVPSASTTATGIVQLNDTLTSTASNQALTAAQGKMLNDKIVELDSGKMPVKGRLSVNLNELTATDHTGIWQQSQNAQAHTSLNYPVQKAGTLFVLPSAYVGKQLYLPWDMSVLYTRNTQSDGSWSGWQAIGEVEDSLTSGSQTASLSARQGKALNEAKLDKTDNAVSASRLQTARNIAMTGDGSWNVNFDGSQNATGTMTLANTGVTAGSYNSVTVDAKGRVTRGLTQTHGLVTATTATGTANTATTNGNTFLNIVASGVGTANSVGSSTQITGTNGISVSSDTAGKLIISRDNNSPTATKLQTARTISLTGAVTGSASFDGSGNVNLATTIQSVGERVAVMTGTVAHGGTIPLPAGFSENQCKWFVSPADFETTPHIANNQGDDIFAVKCSTTGRVVTAQVAMVNTSRGRLDNAWKNISANYIIIGVK